MSDERETREKDAELAIKVLGWKRFTFGPASKRSGDRAYWMDTADHQHGPSGIPGAVVEATPDLEPYSDGLRNVPRFHSDAGAMVQLIEGMRAKGWKFRLVSDAGGSEWFAEFIHHSDQKDGWFKAPTPMAAVAAAALAALRGTPEA
jgi:hypothetical protein